MIDPVLLQKGQELGVIAIDEPNNQVTYLLGREGKYQWSDPEEQVRAELILSIIFEYDYSPSRMATEVTVPGRTPNARADVVVFQDDRRRDPYITVETAAPDLSPQEKEQKVEQVFGNANALASEYAVYFDSTAPKRTWRVRGSGGLEREENVIADIPRNYGDTPEYIFIRGGETDLGVVGDHTLAATFEKCHKELWSGGRRDPTEAFDEMSKLMFAKLFDERRTQNGQAYAFQWGGRETDIMVAERVIERYEAARSIDPGVFTQEIRSEPRKVANVVKLLQHISLTRTDLDAKGRAYEQFLGEVFRGRLGQYFTRREVVEFLVSLSQPVLDDVLIDPACGSGGFLVYPMKQVFQQIESAYSGDNQMIFLLKDGFAKNNIYGVEINEKIARVAMMDMVINDDGHTNIENRSAFDNAFVNPNIANSAFSLVLTNPPFGDTVRQDEHDKLGQAELSDYVLSKGQRSAKSEVLFIERCNLFLREGGRLGMVVPDGVLSNPSDQFVREYLLDNFHILAIVTLPSFAFRKAGSGMKTSLVLARKWTSGEQREQDYPIFMAIAEHIGYDSTARPDDNDLPGLLEHYLNQTGSLDDKVIRVRRKDLSNNFRLDPVYYYLGPIIQQAFARIRHPVYTLRQLASEGIQSGKSPPGGATYSVGSVPIIMVGNIAPDGTLDMEKDPCFTDEYFWEEQAARGAARPLDILIAKDGATTGKVGLVPLDHDLDKCLINEHIFRLAVGATFPGDYDPDPADVAALRELNTWYVFFFLKSWLGQQQINREISGGAQGGITKGFVNNIRVPVPPLEERRQFVNSAKREYEAYLRLAAEVASQRSQFEDSLGNGMREWGDSDLSLDQVEGAAYRIFRRL